MSALRSADTSRPAREERAPRPTIWDAHGASVVTLVTLAAFATAVGLLIYLGRGLWFFSDEWAFLLNRRELTLAAVMRPHNEHWVALPVLLYRGLFAVGGLTNYWPYYLTALTFHTAATVAGWLVLRRFGMPPLPALLAGLSLLLMGKASTQLFNAFQIGWTIPILLFLVVLVLLDRTEPTSRRDRWASACLALAMPFAGISISLVAGTAAALVIRRQLRRALLVTGPALASYALWRAIWGVSPPITLETLIRVPGFIGYGLATAVSGFTGLPMAAAGVLLALFGLAVTVRAVRGGLPLPAWASLFALLAFLGIAGIARVPQFGITQARASHYLYLDLLLLLIVLAALLKPLWPAAGTTVPAAGTTMVEVATAVFAACLVVNVFALRDATREHRALKGESAVRIVAANTLLEKGIPHVRDAQPDPDWAPDVTAGKLSALQADGIPMSYRGRVQSTDAVLRDERLRLQHAFLHGPGRTAAVRLVAGSAQVAPARDGCATIRAGSGDVLGLEATQGQLQIDPKADTVVHVGRSERPAAFFGVRLQKATVRHLELALPARPDTGGLLLLSFPDEVELELCAQTFIDAR